MVNFLCHLGWAVAPRYVVKHYSGFFCEDVFGWDLHLNRWTLRKAAALHNVDEPLPISWKPEKHRGRLPWSRKWIPQLTAFRSELCHPATLSVLFHWRTLTTTVLFLFPFLNRWGDWVFTNLNNLPDIASKCWSRPPGSRPALSCREVEEGSLSWLLLSSLWSGKFWIAGLFRNHL